MLDILNLVSGDDNIHITDIPDALKEPLFAAYPYEDDLILYGELHIFRVTRNLDIVWSYFGADIFVLCNSNEPAFEMKEDRICMYDFLGNYYEIDYDGNELMKRRHE